MPLAEFIEELENVTSEADQAFANANTDEMLEEARVEFLGAKKGRLKDVQKMMGSVEKEDKPAAGQKLNESKQKIQLAFDEAKGRLSQSSSQTRDPKFDPSLPGNRPRVGRLGVPCLTGRLA